MKRHEPVVAHAAGLCSFPCGIRSVVKKARVLLAISFIVTGLLAACTAAPVLPEETDVPESSPVQTDSGNGEAEARQIKYDRIMHSGLFLPGITIEGIDVVGMNRIEAAEAIAPVISARQPSGTLDLVYGDRNWQIDLTSFVKVQNDSEAVLDAALKAARSDDMDTALKTAEEIAENGRDFHLSFSYRYNDLSDLVSGIASEIDVAARTARFVNIDKDAHTADVADSVTGLAVQQEALENLIREAVESGNTAPVEIPVEATEPYTPSAPFVVREFEFSTSFKGSTENRSHNIVKGTGIVNGTLLLPGEVFSMNDTLGTRSLSAGWLEANAYVSGGTDLQAGGGVCQISTTLYNTAVMADLEIVARQNHSMPVSYIKKGLDATINSVGFIIDFQFRNNTPYDILIFTWTERKILHTKILRCAFETDEYDQIKLDSEQISTIEPSGETVVTQDDTLRPGETVTDVARRTGSVWQSYKNYYKHGKLVKSEPLAKSTYKAYNGAVRVGPPVTDAAPDYSSEDGPVIIVG